MMTLHSISNNHDWKQWLSISVSHQVYAYGSANPQTLFRQWLRRHWHHPGIIRRVTHTHNSIFFICLVWWSRCRGLSMWGRRSYSTCSKRPLVRNIWRHSWPPPPEWKPSPPCSACFCRLRLWTQPPQSGFQFSSVFRCCRLNHRRWSVALVSLRSSTFRRIFCGERSYASVVYVS